MLETLTIAAARFRFGSWQANPAIAYIVPLTRAASLGGAVLAELENQLGARGYTSVVTAALASAESDALVRGGYRVTEELCLLEHDLSSPLPRYTRNNKPRTRRGRRRDEFSLLRLDAVAFEPFWRIDRSGLHEAMLATGRSRLRVVSGDPDIAAYSVTGQAGKQGFLQRIAVSPQQQGRGLGQLLVSDALRWLRRGAANSVLVNTQLDNQRALALYARCGFEIRPDRLTVLWRNLQ